MDVSTVNLVLNLIRPNPIGIASALPCSALFCPPLVSSRLLSYPLLPSSSSTPPLWLVKACCLVLSCLAFHSNTLLPQTTLRRARLRFSPAASGSFLWIVRCQ